VISAPESSTTTGVWLDLATVGPLIVVPRAGDYQASGGANFYGPTNQNSLCAIANGATTPTGIISGGGGNTAGYPTPASCEARLLGIAASSDIRLRYQFNTAGTNNAQQRFIRVQPIRVS
jgi:hypothetical protein